MSRQIPVLDQGWVELQDVMGDDGSIVSAARTSFLGESRGPDADRRLLVRLMRDQHTSPFEFVKFRFRIHAPLVVWWQMVRHRTASLAMQSGRYTEFTEAGSYVPAVWRRQATNNKQGSDGALGLTDAEHLTTLLMAHYEASYRLYRDALESGVAREQARLFLPGFGVYYTGVWGIDAHNLMRFLRLRLAEDAQWETRQYAEAIAGLFETALPWTAAAFREAESR
jgi:thymidylate synthase (FAD)